MGCPSLSEVDRSQNHIGLCTLLINGDELDLVAVELDVIVFIRINPDKVGLVEAVEVTLLAELLKRVIVELL